MTREPIPVLPTVHYNMGGVPTNYHAEVIRPTASDADAICPGLMAIGEAACVSVHGANRLGTNSLVDLVVFGRAAALRTAELIKPGQAHKPLARDANDQALARFDRHRNASGKYGTAELRLRLQRAMQTHCAVFRDGKFIAEGIKAVDQIHADTAELGISDRSLVWNSDLVEALEFDNLISPVRSDVGLGLEPHRKPWCPFTRRFP